MRLELFTICDGAYNYNGKLTIVGTIDAFILKQIPASVNFGIAIRILAYPNDKGSHPLKISIYGPDGKELPGEIKVDLNVMPSEDISHISLAANVNGFPISQFGNHLVKIYIDNDIIAEYPLLINQRQ